MRRATQAKQTYRVKISISIHALLAESDLIYKRCKLGRHNGFLSTLSLRRATRIFLDLTLQERDFYPRSPCGERPWQRGSRITYVEFLSTLSLRRATQTRMSTGCAYMYFYPRSPCGERHCSPSAFNSALNNFYPRSPCGERHPLRQF